MFQGYISEIYWNICLLNHRLNPHFQVEKRSFVTLFRIQLNFSILLEKKILVNFDFHNSNVWLGVRRHVVLYLYFPEFKRNIET